MTICFVTEYFPPFAPGGAEWSNALLARALGRRGHRVVVVTPNYGAARREEHPGVVVHRVPFPLKLAAGQAEVSWLAHRNPVFYVYLAWCLWRIGRRERPAVIHAQNKAALIPAWIAGRLLGCPVVFTVRDVGLLCPLGMCTLFEPWSVFDCTFRQYRRRCVPYFREHYHGGAPERVRDRAVLMYAWLDQRLRQAVLRRIDRVVSVSRGIASIHPARLLRPGAVRVIHSPPPPVRPLSFTDASETRRRLGLGDGPLVLYAGKLSHGKGAGVLLDAVDLVRAKVPNASFVLAGKGDRPVPAREGVRHLGALPQDDLFTLYVAADVVVVPSSWPEPLSRVILEAMALGRPVVATAVGGSPEAVEDGVTGLLVPKNDAWALSRAVAELLLDPDRRHRMGEAARRRVATVFDEDRLVTALLECYGEARRR